MPAWPNHRSQPIWGTKFYAWVLFIDGEIEDVNKIRKVHYTLHPTFEQKTIENKLVKDRFRIDARGWGSFYIRVKIFYINGLTEELPYFLDVNQFYKSKTPQKLKKCIHSQISDAQLLNLFNSGTKDFSNVQVLATEKDSLVGSNLVGGNFENASLSDLDFSGANIAMSNFQNANLSNSNFCGANLTRCRLSGANLNGTNLYGTNRTEWITEGANAKYVFADELGKNRIPPERDFGPDEFTEWLQRMPELGDVLPSYAPLVFLSYAHVNERAVMAVDQWLRNHGIRAEIDVRDFQAGDDIIDSISDSISRCDKVIVFYSEASRDRPYPKLERRLAMNRELNQPIVDADPTPRFIYFCLDEAALPVEVEHRLAIQASGQSFEDACTKLVDAVWGRQRQPTNIDLTEIKNDAQWNLPK